MLVQPDCLTCMCARLVFRRCYCRAQDLLRLLTLWFTHGSRPSVISSLETGLGSISIDTWLQVRCYAGGP